MILSREIFERLCWSRELLAEAGEGALSVREIAAEVGVSPFQLIRQFDALFGVTPHQFRLRSRIERAKVLLAAGADPVTEVSMEAGFASLGRFNETFLRRVGVTPMAFRKESRVIVAVPGVLPIRLFPGCLSLMGMLPADRAIFGKREARVVG